MVKTRLGAFIIGFWAGSLYAVQMLFGRFSNRMSWDGVGSTMWQPLHIVRVRITVTFRVTFCGEQKNEMFGLGLGLGLHFREKISN